MERLKKLTLLFFLLLSFQINAYDWSYLDNIFEDRGFEKYFYLIIKDVINRGEREEYFNTTKYSLEESVVTVIEDSISKTRKSFDTIIVFSNQKYGIDEITIVFNTDYDYFTFYFKNGDKIIRIFNNTADILEIRSGQENIILNKMELK
jgi:hypothetical protein